MNGWEVRTLPYKNPRTGIVSDTEITIKSIHRANGWVMTVERAAPERVVTYDPAADWASRH